jgi:hypothetical protein
MEDLENWNFPEVESHKNERFECTENKWLLCYQQQRILCAVNSEVLTSFSPQENNLAVDCRESPIVVLCSRSQGCVSFYFVDLVFLFLSVSILSTLPST